MSHGQQKQTWAGPLGRHVALSKVMRASRTSYSTHARPVGKPNPRREAPRRTRSPPATAPITSTCTPTHAPRTPVVRTREAWPRMRRQSHHQHTTRCDEGHARRCFPRVAAAERRAGRRSGGRGACPHVASSPPPPRQPILNSPRLVSPPYTLTRWSPLRPQTPCRRPRRRRTTRPPSRSFRRRSWSTRRPPRC